MPEGPELHMAARFINQVAKHHKFGGAIVKSEVSTKNPDVEFEAKSYKISAETRGKELKVFLEDQKNAQLKTHILFRFGMSGCFKFTPLELLPKHAHLRFFTIDEKPQQVLSFVDYRRFGRWEIEGDWGKDRGPDPIFDYENFRRNVLYSLDTAAFNRPICEAMLNQKYFNGIGNYLRAEILFRAKIPPFTLARDVLEPLVENTVKSEVPDILELCNIVATEVLSLDKGKNYDPDSEGSEGSFSAWLQCYYVEGMSNLQDHNGRTIWFEGEPGPMAPKKAKQVGRKGGTGSKVPKSGKGADNFKTKIEKEEENIDEIKKVKKDPDIKAPKMKQEPDVEERPNNVKSEPAGRKTRVKRRIVKEETESVEEKPIVVNKVAIKKEVKTDPIDILVPLKRSKRNRTVKKGANLYSED